jgi:hypothetical protein
MGLFGMAKKTPDTLDQSKRLMGALTRMKPKPHEDMKLGKSRPKRHDYAPEKRTALDAWARELEP